MVAIEEKMDTIQRCQEEKMDTLSQKLQDLEEKMDRDGQKRQDELLNMLRGIAESQQQPKTTTS